MKTLFSVLFVAVALSVSAGNSKKAAESKTSTVSTSIASTARISGSIIDSESKERLVGVRVIIDDTDIVSYTDFDGNFSIQLPDNQDNKKVKVSYISYKETEVSIHSNVNNIIEMSPIY